MKQSSFQKSEFQNLGTFKKPQAYSTNILYVFERLTDNLMWSFEALMKEFFFFFPDLKIIHKYSSSSSCLLDILFLSMEV